MPSRKFSAGSSYRYGFNGKENDKDAGEGIQDYGMRIYDGRLGRFLSVDALGSKYPFYSPYQFAGNDVIRCIDLEGGEPESRVEDWDTKSTTWLQGNTDSYDIYDAVTLNAYSVNGVKDPWTGIIWLVAEDNMGRWFYVKNDNGSTDKIRLRHSNGRWLLHQGRMVEFKTRNKIDAEIGAAIADGIGIAVFAGALGISALEAGLNPVTIYKVYQKLKKANEKKNPKDEEKIEPEKSPSESNQNRIEEVEEAVAPERGTRKKEKTDANEQYEGITKEKQIRNKKKPSIKDEKSEWEGVRRRPKEKTIESTGKSKQNQKNQNRKLRNEKRQDNRKD